jgi:hypothetical protein
MKVTITQATQNGCKLVDMPQGSLGVTKSGDVFYRTTFSAVCLNDYRQTYSPPVNWDKLDETVTLLPPGSIVTLEV